MTQDTEPDGFESESDHDLDSDEEDFQMPSPEVFTQKIVSLKNQYIRGDVLLNPNYQREAVWPMCKQQVLINSLMENFYVPPVILKRSNKAGLRGTGGAATAAQVTAIDGRQRLTSIFRFMAGDFPYIDRKKRRWWFVAESSHGRRHTRIFTRAMKEKFQETEILCVEYETITPQQEEDLFSRVQQGVALSNSETIHGLDSPWITFIRGLMTTFPRVTSLCEVTSRGRDFPLFANLLSMLNCRTELDTGEQLPLRVSRAMITSLTEDKTGALLTDDLKKRAIRVFTILDRMAQQYPSTFTSEFDFSRTMRKFAPIEFIATGVLIDLHSKPEAVLNEHILGMRKYIRSGGRSISLKSNSQIWIHLWEYIKTSPSSEMSDSVMNNHANAISRVEMPPAGGIDAIDHPNSPETEEITQSVTKKRSRVAVELQEHRGKDKLNAERSESIVNGASVIKKPKLYSEAAESASRDTHMTCSNQITTSLISASQTDADITRPSNVIDEQTQTYAISNPLSLQPIQSRPQNSPVLKSSKPRTCSLADSPNFDHSSAMNTPSVAVDLHRPESVIDVESPRTGEPAAAEGSFPGNSTIGDTNAQSDGSSLQVPSPIPEDHWSGLDPLFTQHSPTSSEDVPGLALDQVGLDPLFTEPDPPPLSQTQATTAELPCRELAHQPQPSGKAQDQVLARVRQQGTDLVGAPTINNARRVRESPTFSSQSHKQGYYQKRIQHIQEIQHANMPINVAATAYAYQMQGPGPRSPQGHQGLPLGYTLHAPVWAAPPRPTQPQAAVNESYNLNTFYQQQLCSLQIPSGQPQQIPQLFAGGTPHRNEEQQRYQAPPFGWPSYAPNDTRPPRYPTKAYPYQIMQQQFSHPQAALIPTKAMIIPSQPVVSTGPPAQHLVSSTQVAGGSNAANPAPGTNPRRKRRGIRIGLEDEDELEVLTSVKSGAL